jgi:hypothetical protein
MACSFDRHQTIPFTRCGERGEGQPTDMTNLVQIPWSFVSRTPSRLTHCFS